ncbi:hypothetical protein Drorol1_Dr00018901 [Drosera rotundifolia]
MSSGSKQPISSRQASMPLSIRLKFSSSAIDHRAVTGLFSSGLLATCWGSLSWPDLGKGERWFVVIMKEEDDWRRWLAVVTVKTLRRPPWRFDDSLTFGIVGGQRRLGADRDVWSGGSFG